MNNFKVIIQWDMLHVFHITDLLIRRVTMENDQVVAFSGQRFDINQ